MINSDGKSQSYNSKYAILSHNVLICFSKLLRRRHKLLKSCGDRPIFRRLLQDAYFSTSADRRPILLTLNSFENWLSGHLTVTAGRPDGDRPNEAANGQFSRALSDGHRRGICRWPSGLLAISGRCPQIGRLPSDHRRVILLPPAGDRTIIVRFSPPLPQIWAHV